MYIFTYTFFHWYRFFFLFWFSLAIHDFLFWAVDCWGLPPWSPLFPLYYFFVPLALEFSAVDCLGLFLCGFSFSFLSGFFLLFPFHRSSSVFLSAAETNCYGDFPLFPRIFSLKAAGLIHSTDILHSRPQRTIGIPLRSKGFSPQPSTAEL